MTVTRIHIRGLKNSQNSASQLKIIRATRMKWSNFRTEDAEVIGSAVQKCSLASKVAQDICAPLQYIMYTHIYLSLCRYFVFKHSHNLSALKTKKYRCCIIFTGWFPRVWILFADVSEHTVYSILIDGAYEDGKECSETSVHKIQRLGNHPKGRIQHSEHTNSLKLRKIYPIKLHARKA